jgi:hypothetical protein
MASCGAIMDKSYCDEAQPSDMAAAHESHTLVRRFSAKVGNEMPDNRVAQAVMQVENEVQRKERAVKMWQTYLAGQESRCGSYLF